MEPVLGRGDSGGRGDAEIGCQEERGNRGAGIGPCESVAGDSALSEQWHFVSQRVAACLPSCVCMDLMAAGRPVRAHRGLFPVGLGGFDPPHSPPVCKRGSY